MKQQKYSQDQSQNQKQNMREQKKNASYFGKKI